MLHSLHLPAEPFRDNSTTTDQLYFLLFPLLVIGAFHQLTFLYLKHLRQQFWWVDRCVHAVLGSVVTSERRVRARQRLLSRGVSNLCSFFFLSFFFFFLQLASHRSVIISVRSVEQKSRIKYILIRVWSFYLWVCEVESEELETRRKIMNPCLIQVRTKNNGFNKLEPPSCRCFLCTWN